MAPGAWRQPGSPPSVERMADPLDGGSRLLWARLTRWLHGTFGLDGEPAWDGKERGWVLRFSREGRSLVTLSPAADGGFSALVVVWASMLPSASATDLTAPTRSALAAAPADGDGRRLSLRVQDVDTVEDICVVIALKARAPDPRLGASLPTG